MSHEDNLSTREKTKETIYTDMGLHILNNIMLLNHHVRCLHT